MTQLFHITTSTNGENVPSFNNKDTSFRHIDYFHKDLIKEVFSHLDRTSKVSATLVNRHWHQHGIAFVKDEESTKLKAFTVIFLNILKQDKYAVQISLIKECLSKKIDLFSGLDSAAIKELFLEIKSHLVQILTTMEQEDYLVLEKTLQPIQIPLYFNNLFSLAQYILERIASTQNSFFSKFHNLVNLLKKPFEKELRLEDCPIYIDSIFHEIQTDIDTLVDNNKKDDAFVSVVYTIIRTSNFNLMLRAIKLISYIIDKEERRPAFLGFFESFASKKDYLDRVIEGINTIENETVRDEALYQLAYQLFRSHDIDKGMEVIRGIRSEETCILTLTPHIYSNIEILNRPLKTGDTLLHLAVKRNDHVLNLDKLCLSLYKVNLEVRDKKGRTPLYLAAVEVGNPSIVQNLIRHEANLATEDYNGQPLLDAIIYSSQHSNRKEVFDIVKTNLSVVNAELHNQEDVRAAAWEALKRDDMKNFFQQINRGYWLIRDREHLLPFVIEHKCREAIKVLTYWFAREVCNNDSLYKSLDIALKQKNVPLLNLLWWLISTKHLKPEQHTACHFQLVQSIENGSLGEVISAIVYGYSFLQHDDKGEQYLELAKKLQQKELIPNLELLVRSARLRDLSRPKI